MKKSVKIDECALILFERSRTDLFGKVVFGKVYQSINQSLNQSINQSITQSINHPLTNEKVNLWFPRRMQSPKLPTTTSSFSS